MSKERLFLILSILFIFILLLMTEFQKPIASGEIEKISRKYPLEIHLKNQNLEIILFTRESSLKETDRIVVFGTKQNGEELIASKIECLNC